MTGYRWRPWLPPRDQWPGIAQQLRAQGLPYSAIAARFGINPGDAWRLVNGRQRDRPRVRPTRQQLSNRRQRARRLRAAGLTYGEIAARLGVSQGRAWQLVNQGRR